jgi:hypothetical protein
MNGVIIEGTTTPIHIQLADRDYFEHRKVQVQSRVRSETKSQSMSPRVVANSGSHFDFAQYSLPHTHVHVSPPITQSIQYTPYSMAPVPVTISSPYSTILPQSGVALHSLSSLSLSSCSTEYVLHVSGLPPSVTMFHLCSIFSPFGQIIGIELETTSTGQVCLCSGIATIRMFGPLHLRDSALNHLSGSSIFPCDPPLSVTTVSI